MDTSQPEQTETDQRFSVWGSINICVTGTTRFGAPYLHGLIRQLDKENPWVSLFKNGEPAPSLGRMSTVNLWKPSDWNDRTYQINIRPPYPLSLAQLPVYDRYVNRLAEKLAGMDIEGANLASAWLNWLNMKSDGVLYFTPTTMKDLNETVQHEKTIRRMGLLILGIQKS